MRRTGIRIWVIDKGTALVIIFGLFFITIVLSKLVFSTQVIPETENRLKGKTIVIDPGHGGIDGGANIGNTLEKDINLNISHAICTALKASGANVIMTRNTDMSLEGLSGQQGSRYKRDLNARVNIINTSKADLFISIHANCMPSNTSESGTMIFYSKSDSLGRELAENIMNHINMIDQGSIRRKIHSPQIGNYYLLRNANVPGIIIETGFISNTADLRLLQTQGFRRDFVKAVCLGVNEYFKYHVSNSP